MNVLAFVWECMCLCECVRCSETNEHKEKKKISAKGVVSYYLCSGWFVYVVYMAHVINIARFATKSYSNFNGKQKYNEPTACYICAPNVVTILHANPNCVYVYSLTICLFEKLSSKLMTICCSIWQCAKCETKNKKQATSNKIETPNTM